MKNLKIRSKILATFGIVLLLTAIIGVASIASASILGSTAENYVEISIPATNNLLHARRTIRHFQVSILESTAVMTDAELNEVIETMNSDREEFFAYLDAFLELDPQFEGEVTEIRTIMNQAATVREKIITEAKKCTLEGNAEAYSIYETEYLPLLNQVTAILENLTNELSDTIAERHSDAVATKNFVYILIIAIIAFIIVTVLIIATVLSNAIVKPVKEIEAAMTDISNGNLSAADDDIKYRSKDELGSLAHAARKVIRFFEHVLPDISLACQNFGNGNFNCATEHPEWYVGDTKVILENLEFVRDNLSDTLSQVNQASEQVLSGADQVASGSQALAQGATEQASSVQELSATISVISEMVNQNASDAVEANETTNHAGAELAEATAKMEALVAAMKEISEFSEETKKIIKTIEDIAFQTNILALNAAVEAARAGAAGKGFAVVADEVRNLASKSAMASQNTAALIENTVSAIDNGNALVDEVAVKMGPVSEAAGRVAVLNGKISESSREAADAIYQVTVGVDQISGVVQTNSATSEQSAAAAEELTGQANVLRELVGGFNLYEG